MAKCLRKRVTLLSNSVQENHFRVHSPIDGMNPGKTGTVLDGEVVVLRQGKPDFRLLLSRNQARATLKIQSLARTFPATYVSSEGIVGPGRAFFEAVCREGLEGVVAKRLDGRYRPGRRDWIKIKPWSGFPRRHDLLSR